MILNKIMLIFFSIILLYGIYAVWDSVQIDRQADASKYEMYRQDDKNSLSFEKLQKIIINISTQMQKEIFH